MEASIYKDKQTKEIYFFPEQVDNETAEIYKTFNLERSLDATIFQP